MNTKKIYLTTGEFAKLCNTTKDTLYHYDKIKLFSPEKTDTNGYRYYSYYQYDLFCLITALKELNMPLKEIKEYLNKRKPKLLLDLLNVKRNEIDKEIKKLNKIKELIDSASFATLEALQTDTSFIGIKECEAVYGILSSNINNPENSITNFMYEYISFIKEQNVSSTDILGSMIKYKNVKNSLFNNYSYIYRKANESEAPAIEIYKEGKYLVLYHIGEYEKLENTYKKALKYIENNSIEVSSEYCYEEYILYDLAESDSNEYITKIMIPVN